MTPKELKAARQAEVDARTTPTLYFMTARAYHVSARCLMQNPPSRLSHGDVPVRWLLHHAVELYLKAFLLEKGMTPAKLREVGHHYERLAKEAQKRGLGLAAGFADTLTEMEERGGFSRARYQWVGIEPHIDSERLNDLSNALAALVGPVAWPKVQAHLVRPI
jgi:HEPN domain-containing protein